MKTVPKGPKRQQAFVELEAGKDEMMARFMREGTEQRMADLPAVVNDAAQAIDYTLNVLGCQPNNLHLFAVPED